VKGAAKNTTIAKGACCAEKTTAPGRDGTGTGRIAALREATSVDRGTPFARSVPATQSAPEASGTATMIQNVKVEFVGTEIAHGKHPGGTPRMTAANE